MCVHKEWVFQCIVLGEVLPLNYFSSQDEVHVSDSELSEEESEYNKVTVQTSGSKSGKRT